MTRKQQRWQVKLVSILAVFLLLVAPTNLPAISPNAPSTLHQQTSISQPATTPSQPIIFEPNVGQTDPQVQFLARGSGYTLFLTAQEQVMVLAQPQFSNAAKPSIPAQTTNPTIQNFSVLHFQLQGANSITPQPQQELASHSNYFIGIDPSRWHSNVPNYARVLYPNVYPGIDLAYYGSAGKLEHDFIVAAGADPKAIRLKVTGGDKLEVVAGELVLHTAIGELRQSVPRIYQDGVYGRQEISGGYVLLGADEVGFSLAAYDTSRPLTIDPVLDYSTYLGGSNEDVANGVAVDNRGAAYVTGHTFSTNFPTLNALQPMSGTLNAFVSKIDANGVLSFSTYLGGSGTAEGHGIAIDTDGYVYITGGAGPGFPTTSQAFQRIATGWSHIFLSKLNSNGSALLYSTYMLSDPYGSQGSKVVADNHGNAYIVGTSYNTMYTTPDAYMPHHPGGFRVDFGPVIIKIDTTQSYTDSIRYATYFVPEVVGTNISGIALDASNNIYITGNTQARHDNGIWSFPITNNAYQPTNHSNVTGWDAFVTELDYNLGSSPFVYSTFLGGDDDEGEVGGIAVGHDHQIYVTGYTKSHNFPTTNSGYMTTHSNSTNLDMYVTELRPYETNTLLAYSTYLHGTNNESYSIPYGISTYNHGPYDDVVYITGKTSDDHFPTKNALQPNSGGWYDAVLVKLDLRAYGAASLLYSSYLGGSGAEVGNSLAVDRSGVAYVAGVTNSLNFPTHNALQPNNGGGANGGNDAFVSKINPCVPPSQDTQTGEDDYGTTWYSMDLSCTDPNAGLLSSQGNNISFDVPITITRYFGPLQGNSSTGHLIPEAMDTTVLSRSLLLVEGKDDLQNQVISATIGGVTYTLTPMSFYGIVTGVDYTTQFTEIDTNLLTFPITGTLKRDNTTNIVITSSVTSPPLSVNNFKFTTSSQARNKIRRVWLYITGMRPLLLFGGAGGGSSGSNSYNDECSHKQLTNNQFWPDDSWDSRFGHGDPRDAVSAFVVRVPRNPCITIQAGGDDLTVDLQALANAYGVQKVNVLGHSAGGLWARQVAEVSRSKSYSATVDNVMMLGTPNAGSFLENSILYFGTGCGDITCQLNSHYMQLEYNPEHRQTVDVFYEDQAGNHSGGYPPNDGAVDVSSAQALTYSTHLPVVTEDHLPPMANVHTYEIKLTEFRNPFADYYMMRGNHGSYGDYFYWGEHATPLTQQTSNYPSSAGEVQANQTVTNSVLVDRASSATFALSWLNPTSTLKLSLHDPVGHIITPTTTYTGSSYSTCLGCDIANGVQYSISNPMTGTWQMIVQAITTTNTTEPFYTGGEFSGGVQLNPPASLSTARLSQPININATLTDTMPIRGATVTATVMLPYTGTAQVRLNEQTGGLYQGVFTPTVEGSYWVNIEAQGRNTLGQNFDRITSTMLQASSSAAISMTGFSNRAYDSESDGLSNNLVVTSTAVVTQAGKYRLSANLVAQDGRILDYRTGYFNLITGTQQLPLTFDGERIAHAAVDGPYIIRDLNFSHVLSEEITLLDLSAAYTTTAYSRYEWQRDNIMKVGTVTNLGVDNNSNGLYDYLKVIVPLDTRQPGVYGASANLMSADGRLVASTYVNGLVMMTGTNTLVLRFDGPQIRASGINGPYQVKDLLLWSGNNDDYTSMHWVLRQTQAYTSTQFDNTPCTTNFTDVPRGYLFYDDITYLACHDIVTGYSNGNGTYRFEPNSDTKRGEFTRMLVMAFGSSGWIEPTDPTFNDVPTTHPFFSYIELLNQQGVISGFDDEESCGNIRPPCFLPNNAALRGQIALSVRRAANLPLYTPRTPTFSDVPADYWAYEPIESLYHLGIITGSPCSPSSNNLCYRPNDPMLRGELSRVLFKAIQWRSNNP